jgi:uncharacterized protein (DUF4415 family)
MISDEPDEDADLLDDDELIEAVTGSITRPETHGNATADWPPQASNAVTLTVDGDILAWFQARDSQWQHQVRAVLRAWIATQKTPGT